jgi:Fur family ferric uptake transcriptional regulator
MKSAAPKQATVQKTSPALALLQSQRVRSTAARVAVLDVLLATSRALTHQEIAEQTADGLDRVTLYRTLDWLVEQGLAHRIEGQDRVWRFNSAARENNAHAHFHCQGCGRVFCLEQVMPAVAVSLPAGFQLGHAELSLHGRCPDCQKSRPD